MRFGVVERAGATVVPTEALRDRTFNVAFEPRRTEVLRDRTFNVAFELLRTEALRDCTFDVAFELLLKEVFATGFAGLRTDLCLAFAFKLMDLVDTAGRLAVFLIALGFAFALVAIIPQSRLGECGTYKGYRY